MLSEFEAIEAQYTAEKGADLRKACRYLIRNQFAYSGDRGVATTYNTLVDTRFRRVVDEFFDCIGYRVQRNAEEQWVGIVLEDEDFSSVPRLRLDETIVALVLGAHWQEEANVGNLLDRAVAITTFNTLHERYRDMVQSAGKVALPPARFLEILREAASRNLVSIGELDREQQDREVTIRPMIKLVSGPEALTRMEGYVRQEETASDARDDANDEPTGEEERS